MTMKRLLLGASVAFICSTVAISAAPRPDAIATIDLIVPSFAAPTASGTSPAIWPRLGAAISFNATYPKNLEHYGIRVQLMCYTQSGVLIYGETAAWNQQFTLGGSMSTWFLTNGEADCVADLYYWSYQGSQKWNFLAETQFHAY